MTDNIIFVDIDGPLLPGKMGIFSSNRKITHATLDTAVPFFDPFAVRVFNLWARYSDAKIVLSTNWTKHISTDAVKEIMRLNGLGFDYHKDIITPKKLTSSRSNEISFWLSDHPEYKNYIAVDDDQSCQYLYNPRGKWIEVDFTDGLSYTNFLDGCKALNIDIAIIDKEEFNINPLTIEQKKQMIHLESLGF